MTTALLRKKNLRSSQCLSKNISIVANRDSLAQCSSDITSRSLHKDSPAIGYSERLKANTPFMVVSQNCSATATNATQDLINQKNSAGSRSDTSKLIDKDVSASPLNTSLELVGQENCSYRVSVKSCIRTSYRRNF